MLVVVLVLLLCSMLLAAASFEMSTLDERKAGNTRDRQVEFQAAESALRDAEAMLRSDTDGPFQPLRVREFTAQCSNAQCRSTEGAPVWSQLSEADWSGSKTLALGAATGATALTGVAAQLRYDVEYQGTAQPIEPGKPCVAMILITARAGRRHHHQRDAAVGAAAAHRGVLCRCLITCRPAPAPAAACAWQCLSTVTATARPTWTTPATSTTTSGASTSAPAAQRATAWSS